MQCPRCEQGKVVRARILATGQAVRVCEECDALWPGGIEIRQDNFRDFSTFVAPMGLQGLWSELEKTGEE
jgi:hypothetical protein